MNWELFPQLLATGLLTGGVYALIALGIVLIYKSSPIFGTMVFHSQRVFISHASCGGIDGR
ncbi:MAG: hypothetical protein HZC40_21450 [Chloroflexi bacterium]|nr:hypothetical protein [Chloroflexota bacterium]